MKKIARAVLAVSVTAAVFALAAYAGPSQPIRESQIDFTSLLPGNSSTPDLIFNTTNPRTSGKMLSVRSAGAERAVIDWFGSLGLHLGSTPLAYGVQVLGGGARIQQIASPAAPTLATVGTAGAASYTYYVVAIDQFGNKTLAGPTATIATGNATLSGTNYNTISWAAVNGAVSYDVVRSAGGASQGSISLAQTVTSLSDTGLAASAYTAPARNFTGDMQVDGNIATLNAEIDSGTNIGVGQGLVYATGANTTLTIKGNSVADAVAIDSLSNITAGDILRIYNNGVQKARFDQNGTLAFSGTGYITQQGGTTLQLYGGVPAAGGVATALDNGTAQTSGVITSFRTGGVQKAQIDAAGNFSIAGSLLGGAAATAGTAWLIDNQTAQTSGKIASFRSGGVEKSAIQWDGTLDLSGVTGVSAATGQGVGDKISLWSSAPAAAYGFGLQASRIVAYVPTSAGFSVRAASATGAASSGGEGLSLFPNGGVVGNAAATGATAVYLDNATAQTSGKIASFRTGGVEQAYVDYQGQIFSSSNINTGGGGTFSFYGSRVVNGGDSTAFILHTSGSYTSVLGNAPAASSVATILDNATAQTSGTLVSFRTGGVEKAQIDYGGTVRSFSGYFGTTAANSPVVVQGNKVAADPGFDVAASSGVARTAGTLFSVQNNGVAKASFDFNGKPLYPTGGAADVAGRAVLVAGTKTVSTTAVSAASVIMLTNCAGGGTIGLPQVGTVTAGTSFVINSVQPGTASTLQAADTSTVCWSLVN